MIEISDVYIRRLEPGRLSHKRIARANFTLGGMVSIKGCSILQFDDGRLIVAMPTHRISGECPRPGGKTFYYDETGAPYHFRDMVVLTSADSRRLVETVVLQCYLTTIAAGVREAAFEVDGGDDLRPAAIGRRIHRVPVHPPYSATPTPTPTPTPVSTDKKDRVHG